MVPAIAFVGRHNAGKTTVLVALLSELKKRGLRVGVLKSSKEVGPTEPSNCDTLQFREAGAERVVFWGQGLLQVTAPAPPKDDFAFWSIVFHYFSGLDLVLVEGLKGIKSLPKIEVYRRGLSQKPLWEEGLYGLVACVGDRCAPFTAHFGFGQIKELANFVLSRLPKRRVTVELLVDNRPVGLTRFVAEALWASVGGFIQTLRGVKNPDHIELRLRR